MSKSTISTFELFRMFPDQESASVTGRNAVGFTHRHVQVGSTVHTDESGIYNRVGGLLYRHETINHGAGEYVRGVRIA